MQITIKQQPYQISIQNSKIITNNEATKAPMVNIVVTLIKNYFK